jgi:hypothetical protein
MGVRDPNVDCAGFRLAEITKFRSNISKLGIPILLEHFLEKYLYPAKKWGFYGLVTPLATIWYHILVWCIFCEALRTVLPTSTNTNVDFAEITKNIQVRE